MVLVKASMIVTTTSTYKETRWGDDGDASKGNTCGYHVPEILRQISYASDKVQSKSTYQGESICRKSNTTKVQRCDFGDIDLTIGQANTERDGIDHFASEEDTWLSSDEDDSNTDNREDGTDAESPSATESISNGTGCEGTKHVGE